jgi:hypothetical protein
VEYSYSADFRGNIDVDVTCEADGERDKSQLYFITKGAYVQKSAHVEAKEVTSEGGTIYATGYVAQDGSAKGEITITTDRKWSAVYDWEAAGGDFGVDE